MTDWVRPEHLPYPNVWRKFTRITSDGREHTFRIQDAAQDMLDDIFSLFKVHFMQDEPLCQCLDILHDEVSLKELHSYWQMELGRKTLIVCFEENGPDGEDVLVSCNVMGVRTLGNLLSVPATGTTLITFNKIMAHIMLDEAKIYETFKVNRYLSAYGLSVHREYRGIGIGVQMLLARTEYCKAIDIPFTVTAFTSKGGQSAGAKAGFILQLSKTYTDIEKVLNVSLPGIKHDCMKVMYKRFDE